MGEAIDEFLAFLEELTVECVSNVKANRGRPGGIFVLDASVRLAWLLRDANQPNQEFAACACPLRMPTDHHRSSAAGLQLALRTGSALASLDARQRRERAWGTSELRIGSGVGEGTESPQGSESS